MVSSGTGFSPSVFSWINFHHDTCHEKININHIMTMWIQCLVDNQSYDWSLLKKASSVNIKEFSNVDVQKIFQMISNMPELSSLDIPGKHHSVLNNFIINDFKICKLFFLQKYLTKNLKF